MVICPLGLLWLLSGSPSHSWRKKYFAFEYSSFLQLCCEGQKTEQWTSFVVYSRCCICCIYDCCIWTQLSPKGPDLVFNITHDWVCKNMIPSHLAFHYKQHPKWRNTNILTLWPNHSTPYNFLFGVRQDKKSTGERWKGPVRKRTREGTREGKEGKKRR